MSTQVVIFSLFKHTRQSIVLLLMWCLALSRLDAEATGPTLQFDYGRGSPLTNTISEFMYFVPLISPEPVAVFTSDGNTQCARVLSSFSQRNGATFAASYEFEITGDGLQRYVFDHEKIITKNLADLQAGDSLARQLASINVEGAGRGRVEIEGDWTQGQPTVNEVRLRFNEQGKSSPVLIHLHDISFRDGTVEVKNEIVARVNTLTFQRKPGSPKMEVALASVKRKDDGNGAWQKFTGSLKGSLANLFIPPLAVEAEGQQAMLDFGLALALEKPEFTFPHSKRLKTD